MISPESSNSSLHGIWPDYEFKSPKVLISGKQNVSISDLHLICSADQQVKCVELGSASKIFSK